MNAVFFVIIFASILLLTITAPESVFVTMIDGAQNAIGLGVKLFAIYAVWLSALKMAEKTSLDKKLSKLLRPVVCKIFKNESDVAYDKICVNLSANILGMGGVATPAGIKAMNLMSDGSEKATDNMILLLVINATSIQLIPATMIALRAQAGASSPSDIILPTLISSGVATLVGALMCKALSLKQNNKNTLLYNKNSNIKYRFGKKI